MRRWLRWVLRVLLTAIVLAGIALLFTPVRDAVWTTLFVVDALGEDDSSLYKLLTFPPGISSHTLVVGDGTQVPFDLYRPPSTAPTAAIVFTHGLAHLGNQDPRVRAHARRLARAGFVVLAPDLQQMKTYRLGFEDVEAMAACLDTLRRMPGVDSTRVGVVAPSFGAGPVLIAISRPPTCDQVRFALIFAGYYDLKRTLCYTLTGGAGDAEGFERKVDLSKNRQNRWKFLRGNMHLLPDSPSRQAYIRFLDSKKDNPTLDIRPVLSGFSEAEQSLLVFIDNEDPARFDSLYATVPTSVHAWIDTFSLYHYTSGIKARLLIVHSETDDKVLFTESLALSRDLPNAPEPLVVIVGLFRHVNLKLKWRSFEVVWKEVVPDLQQLWSLVHTLLRQQP